MSKLCIPLDVEDVCRKEDKKNPASMNRKPIHKPLHPLFVSDDWVVGWAWPPIRRLKRPRLVAGYLRVISAKKTSARLSVSSDEIFSAARARSRDEPTSAKKTKHGQHQEGERKRNL